MKSANSAYFAANSRSALGATIDTLAGCGLARIVLAGVSSHGAR
jgi:hypothetical protein